MPTISNSVFLPTQDWNEFEDICLSACKLRWKNPNLTRHGRQGQSQQGVDIYGNDNLGQPIGVQCKNTLALITPAIIDAEIQKAGKFDPPISALYIATSSPSDAKLQHYVRKVSQQREAESKFTVSILFWSDLMQDLAKDQSEVIRFYREYFQSADPVLNTTTNDRQKDVLHLTDLLNCIDMANLYTYLEYDPKYIRMEFIDHIKLFNEIRYSPVFQLHDKKLSTCLFRWLDKWVEIGDQVSLAPYNYLAHMNALSFSLPGDFCSNEQDLKAYNNLEKLIKEFVGLNKEFCDFLKDNFPEIDLRETSVNARRLYSFI